MIAIGGGKGGIGKTVVAASMATGLARLRKKTVVIDADLGGSDLHTVFGIERPSRTLIDFLRKKVKFEDILVDHPSIENLQVVYGAGGAFGVANMKYLQKMKLIRKIRGIQADFVILDLGAGTGYNVLDLFLTADLGIVMVNPEPLSVLGGYDFVKQVFYRKMIKSLKDYVEPLDLIKKHASVETFREATTVDEIFMQVTRMDNDAGRIMQDVLNSFRLLLLINKLDSEEREADGLAVQVAAQELLSLNIEYLGAIRFDPVVSTSVSEGKPFILFDSRCWASRDLANLIILRILGHGKIKAILERQSVRRETEGAYDVSSDTVICSVRCIYWEECPYKEGGYPCRMQHLLGIRGFQEE